MRGTCMSRTWVKYVIVLQIHRYTNTIIIQVYLGLRVVEKFWVEAIFCEIGP